ncbi:hypothetical protein [Frankia sp. Cppng1_Ct_nod]|uniref:lytic transglycosylase domain-containing protein n=1 Tax=Frankia sp. Cppng1_Ct_nod TaxID=2897162 RepID=UPI0010419E46|nr:hypothetical protein [Frankia sp. Cppng1_Ct_nod]
MPRIVVRDARVLGLTALVVVAASVAAAPQASDSWSRQGERPGDHGSVDGRLERGGDLPASVLSRDAARADEDRLAAEVAAQAPPITTTANASTVSTASTSAATPTGTGGDGRVRLTGADLAIPTRVLAAYRGAATRINIERPGCRLSWPVLAGIGKVESGHAIGRQISADGTVTPTILGPRLDGSAGTARITDTDGGLLDHDTELDRAVGPMQFIPSTWKWAGRDGNGDGTASPDNISDATLAAAGYLCRAGDLSVPERLTAAVHSYNPSDEYVRTVLAWADEYASADPAVLAAAGTRADARTPAQAKTPAPAAAAQPQVHTVSLTEPAPSSTPTPTPRAYPSSAPTSAAPAPTPTPSASPSPAANPVPVAASPLSSPTATPTASTTGPGAGGGSCPGWSVVPGPAGVAIVDSGSAVVGVGVGVGADGQAFRDAAANRVPRIEATALPSAAGCAASTP